jgi:ring-1,2-phenylacetyl-CoA epoxidase subunit PaaC
MLSGTATLSGVTLSYLYDVAEDVRLSALENSSYEIIRNRTSRIQGEEGYHVEHAESWLERMAQDSDASQRVQKAIDYLYPYALTLFEPVGDVEEDIEELGVRTMTLDEMREEWEDRITDFLTELGFEVPADEEPATPVGRDNQHTEHWEELYEEMTSAYRNLGRHKATRIMEKGDDE